MQNSQNFKFSNDQLKKINMLLPKGYKFVTREELNKNKIVKTQPKKKISTFLPPQPILPPIDTIPQPPQLQVQPKIKVEKEREDTYQPQNIKIIAPALLVPTEQSPAGTSAIFLQRIKKHPAYNYLFSYKAPNSQGNQLSLKLFEDKINDLGQSYTIEMYSGDLMNYFLQVYQFSNKTSSDYRQAAELEDYIQKLLKLQRIQSRRGEVGRGGGRKKAVPVKTYQPLSSYRAASSKQKIQLGMMIRKLSSQNLNHIITILFESSEVKQYSFDLDNLHIKKFRELQDYVKKCFEKISDWDPKINQDQDLDNYEQFIIQNDDD